MAKEIADTDMLMLSLRTIGGLLTLCAYAILGWAIRSLRHKPRQVGLIAADLSAAMLVAWQCLLLWGSSQDPASALFQINQERYIEALSLIVIPVLIFALGVGAIFHLGTLLINRADSSGGSRLVGGLFLLVGFILPLPGIGFMFLLTRIWARG